MKKVIAVFCLTLWSFCYAQPIRSIIAAEQIKAVEEEQPDPNQYVMDGLIAWYDGEWNVGIGEHDASVTVWKDLSENGNDLQVSGLGYNCYWEDECLRTASTRKDYIYAVANKAIQYETCEFCVEQIEYNGLVSFSGMADEKFFRMGAPTYVQFYSPYTETTNEGIIPTKGCFQCVYLGGSLINAFSNGEPLYRRQQQSSWSYASQKQNFGIGGGSRYALYQMCGRVFCVRMYNRKLSERELAHNLAIDKVRFNLP